jgi:hypothetical protein
MMTGSFCALKGLPYSFVVKVGRRPRRAIALCCSSSAAVAALTSSLPPPPLLTLLSSCEPPPLPKSSDATPHPQKGLPRRLPRVRARALAALEALSGAANIAGDGEEGRAG